MSVSVSVVIPVYNGAKFIARTVRAVLDQSYRDFEIVIVNDGSKDATLQELATFGDAIKVISIPNGGVSNARNVGIKESQGEYIAFLDADDVWIPTKLEKHIRAMKSFDGIGFSCSNYFVKNGAGQLVPHFEQFKSLDKFITDVPMQGDAIYALAQTNFVGTCSNVIVKREVLQRTGLFDTQYRQAEDYDLWLRCAIETEFLTVSEVLLTKTTHETNLTNNYVETLQCHEMVLVNFIKSELIESRQLLLPTLHSSLSEVRYTIGNLLFNRGQVRRCLAYFYSAFKADRCISNGIKFLKLSSTKILRLILEVMHLRKPYREY